MGWVINHKHVLMSTCPHGCVVQMCLYKEQSSLLSSLHHSPDTWITSAQIYLTGKTPAVFLFIHWSSWFCSLSAYSLMFFVLPVEQSVDHHHEDCRGPPLYLWCCVCRWDSTKNTKAEHTHHPCTHEVGTKLLMNKHTQRRQKLTCALLLLTELFLSAAPAEDQKKAPGQC